MTNLRYICNECGCTTYKLLPDPRDRKQEIGICEDCEYAITEKYSAKDIEPIKKYGDKKGT